jgi:hypothetical protein
LKREKQETENENFNGMCIFFSFKIRPKKNINRREEGGNILPTL